MATGSIIGTGLGKKGADVRWGVARRMATAWLFTLPSAGIVGALSYWLAHGIGGSAGVIILLIILAALGWGIYEVYQIGHPPLSTSRQPHSRGFTNMALPPFLSSVIEWLRAGYPEGVPEVDYVPLFALLGSQLSESDVKAIAAELENESKPESAEAISEAIATVTDHQASDADVARVRSRLAAGGWPLAKPEHFDPVNWP